MGKCSTIDMMSSFVPTKKLRTKIIMTFPLTYWNKKQSVVIRLNNNENKHKYKANISSSKGFLTLKWNLPRKC
jgi:hypothetical protein